VLRKIIEERFRLIWVTLALCAVGFFAFDRTAMELLPRSAARQYAVIIPEPGLSDSDSAKQIEKIVRETATRIEGVEHIRTEITTNALISKISGSKIPTRFAENMRSSLKRTFSDNGIEKYIQVLSLGAESISTMDLVISERENNEKKDPQNTQKVISQKIIPILEQLDGVSAIEATGLAPNSITLSPRALGHMSQNASPLRIAVETANALRTPFTTRDTPFGFLSYYFANYAQTITDIKIPLRNNSGNAPKLGELFKIEQQQVGEGEIVLSESQPAALLAVFNAPNANSVDTSKKVRAVVAAINQSEKNILATVVSDSADYIAAAQESVSENLLWGVILTCLCILLFTGNMRYTAIASISIPVSLALTFPFFPLFNITRNVMSLAGITLSVGVVVDATISVIDGIDDAMKKGFSAREAAFRSSFENLPAVSLTALTTFAVFAPILFLDGMVGDLFRELSLTVIISQAVSFVVAIFIVPGITSLLYEILNVNFKQQNEKRTSKDFWSRSFSAVVIRLLKQKAYYWSAGIASLLLVIWSLTLVPATEFLPKRPTDEFRLVVSNVQGSAEGKSIIARTDATLKKMGTSKRLLIFRGDAITGDFTLPNAEQKSISDLEKTLSEALAPLLVVVSRRNPIDVDATNGRDLEFFIPTNLRDRDSFKIKINSLIGVESPRWSGDVTEPVAPLQPDGKLMQTLPAPVGHTWEFWNFLYGKHLLGVEVPSNIRERGASPKLVWRKNSAGEARIHPAIKTTVPQYSVSTLSQIKRAPSRNIFVDGTAVEQVMLKLNGKTTAEIGSLISILAKESAIPIFWGEGKEDSDRSIRNLAICFAIAALMIIILLLWQNRSFMVTTVIMCTFAWGLIGAFPGLTLHHETMNASAIVGFILLAGTIVNNGILLMEIVGRARATQTPPRESCLVAVSHRTVPVLITALTTAVGMIPMVISRGEGSQMYRALSIVVVYGTMLSTPISLIAIPCVFLILNDIREWVERARLRTIVFLHELWMWRGKESR